MQKRKRRVVSSIAFSEITLLILSTIAISFIIGQTQLVSADDIIDTTGPNEGNPSPKIDLGKDSLLGASGTDSAARAKEAADAEAAAKAAKEAKDKTGATDKKDEGLGGLLTSILGGTFGSDEGKVTLLGGLMSSLVWAGIVYGGVKLVGGMFGLDDKLTNSLAMAGFAGVATGRIAYFLISENVFNAGGNVPILGGATSAGFIIGLGVAAAVFLLTYKKESKKIVSLECRPWEAPLGGSDCEKCNQDPLRPCSEYRCKSLGQACEIVNTGTTDERCVWVSRNDVNSPLITPWTDVLTAGYTYTDITGRPPSRGTKIVGDANGCVKPFTPLSFGLRTNEPAQCKIDYTGNKTFDEMQFYFGESNLYAYNHTQSLRLPSPESLTIEAPETPNEGLYNMYVRCRDANGNQNDDEFVFNFCVDKSPDTTPPVIESTSILPDSPVGFGIQNISFALYVNEPSECKWSMQDKNYADMENAMACSTKVYEQNAHQLYPCASTLNGIKDHQANAFYFRCKDQPSKPDNERNVNTQSYALSLKGTQPLNILSVGPNETFVGSTDLISLDLAAVTDDGAEEGKSICYFSDTGDEDDFVSMFETNSERHSQPITLPSGTYTYFFRCVDRGGNAAEQNTSFTVALDRDAPKITRVYKEGPDALKVVTDEEALCVYSLSSCNYVFEEGLPMRLLNVDVANVYAAEWKPNQAYYIKCADAYGNQPSPNACSVVATATTLI